MIKDKKSKYNYVLYLANSFGIIPTKEMWYLSEHFMNLLKNHLR